MLHDEQSHGLGVQRKPLGQQDEIADDFSFRTLCHSEKEFQPNNVSLSWPASLGYQMRQE